MSKKNTGSYLLICGVVFAADQFCKYRVKRKITPEKPKSVKAGPARIGLHNSRNYGAFLNSLDRHPGIVCAVSLVLTLFCFIWFLLTLGRGGKRGLKTGLALLTGGALSNTCDRVRDGYVTDYISFPDAPGGMNRIVYNLGDFAIAAGAVLTGLTAEDTPEAEELPQECICS